ncbi:MAG: toluene tolerance protein [Ponticaulis sp.]|nr:toluene tolerance protein [Ponticaulis sp.]
MKHLALSTGLSVLAALPGFADAATESYVAKNANEALVALNDPQLTSTERRAEFQNLMNQFTDMDRVSRFVLGKYANRFSESEMNAYNAAYRRYALATYEAQLDQYRGEEIVVTGSVDRSENDSIVETVIKRPSGDLPVKWRVMKVDPDASAPYQVVDVALELDGNLLWLALEQRAQFLSLLDRTNGRADALIEKIDEMTERLESQAQAQ